VFFFVALFFLISPHLALSIQLYMTALILAQAHGLAPIRMTLRLLVHRHRSANTATFIMQKSTDYLLPTYKPIKIEAANWIKFSRFIYMGSHNTTA
jgi:hypothetical protein